MLSKQILHLATGEMSKSFRGFLVPELFTGKTLYIYTVNRAMQRLLSNCLLVRIHPLTESDLAEHLSLTSLLSLSIILLLLLQFGNPDAPSVRDSGCRLLFSSAVQPKWHLGHCLGVMVAYWFALWPHSKKVQDLSTG